MKVLYLLIGIVIFVLTTGCFQNSKTNDSIIILSWSGYDEKDFVDEISKKSGFSNFKFIKYTTGEDMLRKFSQHFENLDLVVVDAEYGKILHEKKQIKLLQYSKELEHTLENDYFPRFVNADDRPCYDKSKSQHYCLVIRWGTIGLAFDLDIQDEVLSEGYGALLNNEVLIFDWYLPNIGIFSQHSYHKDKSEISIFDLNYGELHTKVSPFMKKVRPFVGEFQPNLNLVIDGLYSGSYNIVPGVGEWVIGNHSLKECESGKKPTKDWIIPKQGGLIWIEALAVPNNKKSKDRADIHRVIEAFSQPSIQSKLAWRTAYASQVPNKLSYNLMSECQKNILKFESAKSENQFSTLDYYLDPNKTLFRKVPVNYEDWTRIWADFKVMKQ